MKKDDSGELSAIGKMQQEFLLCIVVVAVSIVAGAVGLLTVFPLWARLVAGLVPATWLIWECRTLFGKHCGRLLERYRGTRRD